MRNTNGQSLFLQATIRYVLAKITTAAVGFITSILLIRMLRPEQFGIYALDLSIIVLGSNLLFDWLAQGFQRWYQAEKDAQTFTSTTVALFILLCVFSALALLVVTMIGVTRGFVVEGWILLIGIWTYAWFEFVAYMQVLRFRPSRYVVLNLIRTSLILAASTLTAHFTGSPRIVIAATTGSILAASFVYIKDGSLSCSRSLDAALVRRLIAFGWPIGLTNALNALLGTANRAMLVAMVDAAAAGYFSAASALVQGSIGVLTGGVSVALWPSAVEAMENGGAKRARNQLSKGIACMLAISLPAGVGLALVIPRAAAVIYTERYHESVSMLTPWLVTASILSGIKAYYIDFALQLAKRTDLLLRIAAICTAASLGFNFLFISWFGGLGPAVAMVCALGISTAYGFAVAQQVFPLSFPVAELGRIGVATTIMGWVVAQTPGDPKLLELVAEIVLGASVYGGAATITNVLGVRTSLLGRIRRLVETRPVRNEERL